MLKNIDEIQHDSKKYRYISSIIGCMRLFILDILKRILFRLTSYIVLGTLLRLSITWVFDLIYIKSIFTTERLISTIILNAFIMEVVRYTNKRLDKKLTWAVKPLKRFLIQFGLNIPIILVITTIADFYTGYFIIKAPEYLNFQFDILINDFLIVYYVVLIFSVLYICIDLIIYLLHEWRSSLILTERYKRESVDNQLQALKNQVDPHFLFNSLNTLSSLIYESQDKASEYVRKLSNVYRRVLEVAPSEKITIKEELETLQSYIFLVETRFVDRIHIEIEISEPIKEKLVLPLTLQMLIENAVKHNVVSESRPLRIKIYEDDNYLVVSNKIQTKRTVLSSTKLGLENLKSRYAYFTNIPFKIVDDGEFFSVYVPILEPDKL